MPLDDFSIDTSLGSQRLTNPENVDAYDDNQTHCDPDSVVRLLVPKINNGCGGGQFS